MSDLVKLQSAKTLADVATLLGYQTSGLAFLLYRLPATAKYIEFEIPKRSGDTRRIFAPTPRLKLLQQRLAELLYQALDDIDKTGTPRRTLSHGFTKRRSIVTNALVHKNRRFVLNLDLKDFFPSINFGRVRGVLIKDKRFGLDANVATIIAQIACHDNALPQGSPCSPVLSNIVGNLLDIRMVRFARAHKCTYSRYADDITFSTNKKDFPGALASLVRGSEGRWSLGTALEREISGAGFEVNPKKTRMQLRGSRQVTTGLLVNKKPNIRPEYYRTARAMCWSLFNKGLYYRMVPAPLAGGKSGDPDVKQQLSGLDTLQGVLGHIHYVRNAVDARESRDKKKDSSATRDLYRRFLFYKNFVVPPMPLVIPEGKTDAIYLRAAIERLTAYHPRIGTFENERFKSAIRFLNFSPTVHEILQLGHGTGDLKHFIRKYSDDLKRFRHKPLPYPVIVLIDNDDGAKDIFSIAKKNLGVQSVSLTSTDPFYRLAENLYLVKTPEIGTAGTSRIEDLFDLQLLETKIDGKIFDPKMEKGAAGKYGKTVFAEKVVRANRDKVNFAKFSTLLDRVVAVLDDYAINPPNP